MNQLNLDPITTEIIQSSLQAACDEMFVAMRKTAMSSIIYEVLDFGTAVTDSNGNIIEKPYFKTLNELKRHMLFDSRVSLKIHFLILYNHLY